MGCGAKDTGLAPPGKTRKVIWGWNEMAMKLRQYVKGDNENLREEFFEARYRLSETYYEHAMLQKQQKDRGKLLDLGAFRPCEVAATVRLFVRRIDAPGEEHLELRVDA